MISQDMNRMPGACTFFSPTALWLLLAGMWMLLSFSTGLAQDKDRGQEAQAGEEVEAQHKEPDSQFANPWTASQAEQDHVTGKAGRLQRKAGQATAKTEPPETQKGFTLKIPRLVPDLHITAWSKHLASKFRPRATHRANPVTLVVVGFFMVFFWMLILIGALIAANASGSYGLVILAILLFPSLVTGLVLLLWGVIAGAQ
jgi:hypothetical protein